jgi:WD repeat and SOF domain-containing protein 1
VHTYSWGCDSVNCVAFNPAEACVLLTTASDRSICLYDVRQEQPMRKVILAMKSNKAAWNPMEPFNFVVANEDHNCYTFDMRKMNKPKMVHKDHQGAVMDISYSPTGKEFVTGSYDKSIRIFGAQEGKSREIYHTKRMQRVFCVKFSQDAKFVLSGSDDTNLRVWKAQASQSLGKMVPRQEKKLEYQAKLKRRYEGVDEIRKISKHRHLPKRIMKAKRETQIVKDSKERKQTNRRAHSKPGTVPFVGERTKAVLREME